MEKSMVVMNLIQNVECWHIGLRITFAPHIFSSSRFIIKLFRGPYSISLLGIGLRTGFDVVY